MIASSFGHASLLIKAGTDVNHAAVNGNTSLILACGESLDCARLLLEAGADVLAHQRWAYCDRLWE